MIGLDTNVLVRYLTEDDPRQARVARELMESKLTSENVGFIASVTLAELVWVMVKAYDASRAEVIRLVDRLLAMPTLSLEHRAEVRRALEEFSSSRADFADCLMGKINARHGCEFTATFDRRASALPDFRLLGRAG